MIEYDLGQATIQMAVTAADLGIMLALGYPARRPLTPLTKISRRPFGAVVHRGRW